MREIRAVGLVLAASVAAFVVLGCGGNRLVTNRDGRVESGELVLDSIPHRQSSEQYTIGYGDKMDVLFLFNKELDQVDVRVRPDGRISLPYVGEVQASGMAVAELDSLLTARYSALVVNPDITVIMRDFAAQVVYVLGEVQDAGGYPYTQGMTLLKVLALGRWLTMKAKENGVIVIRRIAPDHIVGIEIDVADLVKGKRFDLDIPLEPNDIVYVPKSKIGRAQDFSESLASVLTKPMDIYLKGWQVANVKILYDFYRKTATTP